MDDTPQQQVPGGGGGDPSVDNTNKTTENDNAGEQATNQIDDNMPMDIAEPPTSVLDEAHDFLAKGKRLRALDDVISAADCLEQSCQLFDAYYGVGKRECADAYLEYGLALVALADLETGTGTDKLLKKAGIDDGEEEEEDDEEQEEGEEEDEEEHEGEESAETDGNKQPPQTEDLSEDKVEQTKVSTDESKAPTQHSDSNKLDAEQPSATTTANDDTQKTNNSEPPQQHSDQSKEPATTTKEQRLDDQQPGTSKETTNGHSNQEDKSDDGEANDDPTTIEIAWEVLSLARRVFQRDESYDGRLKLAETLQKLGEISIEWDNNENAVDILEECLIIRTAILPEFSRLIALTYYNLGLAHSFKGNTPKANENFQNAVKVVEKNIATQQESLEAAKKSQDTVAIAKYTREIAELKELIPEIVMRVDDTNDDDAKNSEVLKRQREEMEKEEEDIKKVCSDKSKPVDDISHLVKRRA